MNKEHKIFLEPEDGIAEAVEKIKEGKGDKIILHIPEGSVLKSSMDNFYAIKEEIESEDKEMVIESVDPYIEEVAERAGLKAVNPIFGKEENFVSDIIPRGKNHKLKSDDVLQTPEISPEKEEKTYEFFTAPKNKKAEKEEKKRDKKEEKKKKKELKPVNKKKRALAVTGTLFLLALFGFLAVEVLPKADINVVLKKSSLSFDETIKASASVHEAAIKGENIILPGEMLVATKNIEKRFSASGKKKVEQKATGEIYIYNEYSSKSVPLIPNTRFVSPSGKVFRLTKKTTIPGAEVIGGELLPQKMKASIVAEEVGEEYNIDPDPEKKWPLPALKENFQSSGEPVYKEMYENLYAKPIGAMEGGYSGISRVPTEEDIKKAKEEITKTLRSNLESQLMIAYSKEFKTLEGTRQFKVTNMDVSERANEEGKFSVFAEGEIKAFVFKEGTLRESLIKKNTSPLDFDFNVVDSEFKYSGTKVNWKENSMNFNIQGSLVVEPRVNKENLKAQLTGQAESMIKPVLFSIPNLEKAQISLWPFWVNNVPDDPKKVNIRLK